MSVLGNHGLNRIISERRDGWNIDVLQFSRYSVYNSRERRHYYKLDKAKENKVGEFRGEEVDKGEPDKGVITIGVRNSSSDILRLCASKVRTFKPSLLRTFKQVMVEAAIVLGVPSGKKDSGESCRWIVLILKYLAPFVTCTAWLSKFKESAEWKTFSPLDYHCKLQ